MSELLEHSDKRKELLKHMILQLHEGEAPESVKKQLTRLLGEVPYDDVVVVEQELIEEGLPIEDVLKLCDIHTAALKGKISHEGAKTAPVGHPIHTFKEENRALKWEIDALGKLYDEFSKLNNSDNPADIIAQIRVRFQALSDVEKHYSRKENLLFPYMEKHGIDGPPKVMWGKHDETRELLKAVNESMAELTESSVEEFKSVIDLVLKPATNSIEEMIYKEEEILFPMTLDSLSESEWYSIYKHSLEIGFCLYDPVDEWKPEGKIEETEEDEEKTPSERIQLPSGSMTPDELNAILNSIPFDLTFVDKNDTVQYFTQGRERIFARTRAILGRDVKMCHPPSSVHIVQQIIDDFRSGKEDSAPFWIELHGKFISIEYFALRDKEGNYLGTLEVSQDLTEKRALEGQQRLLSYAKD